MIVVLVALEVERQEVRKRLREVRVERHPAGTHFEVGLVRDGDGPPVQVALALVGRGSSAAGVLAERAITKYQPSALLFVGVAGSLRDWVRLGDVVVATKIYAYHGGRSEAEGFRAYPQAWNIPHEIEQAARHLADSDRWSRAEPGRPEIHLQPIAVGEVVINGPDVPEARQLRRYYADAVAVEMESAGAAHAGHVNRSVPTAAVRGISDLAGGHKDETDAEGWQQRAAAGAAEFALGLAARLGGSDVAPEETGAPSTAPGQGATTSGANSPAVNQVGTINGGMTFHYGQGA